MDPIVQENTCMKAEIARLHAIIAAKDATIKTKDEDGLDLARQIRFKANELVSMTKMIAAQEAVIASQEEDISDLKTCVESTSYQRDQREAEYFLLQAAMASIRSGSQAGAERIADLEGLVDTWQDKWLEERIRGDDLQSEVGDWQDKWMEERSRYDDLLEVVERERAEVERPEEGFEDVQGWIDGRCEE